MKLENMHTKLLDNLNTAILLVNPDQTVGYVNSAAETLLETSGNRILGEPINALLSEQDNSQHSLMRAISNISAFTKRETRLNLPGGQQITVDCVVTPIDDEINTPLILELQPLDRWLRISREESLISSQQNTQALVRGLAHEIKNPLGGLRGAAQLLSKELPDPALVEYTNVIIEEADRLRNLVDRLLGSNKLPDMRLINIHEVLERVRTLIDVEAQHKIQFIRDYDPSIPEVLGDKEQLIQATLNIVRNAMQALQQGIAEPRITLRTRALRQFTIGAKHYRLVCHVEIIDNGPGIPEEIVDTLFFPMISGHPGGTGLGLSIAQNIINHHNGLIECNSQPGQTVFSLFIPLEQKE